MARKRKLRTASRETGGRRLEPQNPEPVSEPAVPAEAAVSPPMPEPGELAARAIDVLTVPRVVLGTLPVLAVLAVAFFVIHSAQIARSRGDRLFAARNWDEAATRYEAAADAYADEPGFQIALARCYLETDRYDLGLERVAAGREALQEINRRRRPAFEANLNALEAWALFASDRPKQGLDILREQYNADKNHVLTNYVLAAFYVGQRDVVSAGPFMRPLMGLPEYADLEDRYRRLLSDLIETDLSGLDTE